MSTTDNRLNRSSDFVESTDIEENVRSEMIPDLPADCDLRDVPKDHKNLIAFFLLGICNTFLFYITSEFQNFYGHSVMFMLAFPIGIVKILPMFLSAFMK